MKERPKAIMQRGIASATECAKLLDIRTGDVAEITNATLPRWLRTIQKQLRRGRYVIAFTPGVCAHCNKFDDLRFGMCMGCVDNCYSDGETVWHESAPDKAWPIPQIDVVLGRVR